jgi:hypothetical protein
MTDLEMVKLCAEAMELAHAVGTTKIVLTDEPGVTVYWPLHDKAQAFELIERLNLNIQSPHPDLPVSENNPWLVTPEFDFYKAKVWGSGLDLARAIVTCVANMQAARRKEGE